MSATLLDGNVLIALAYVHHAHHARAIAWFRETSGPFATNPITQDTLVRFLIREGVATVDVISQLMTVTGNARHRFWPAERQYDHDTLRGVIGHRQVTDAYLASEARGRGARAATLDVGFAASHPDVVELIPT